MVLRDLCHKADTVISHIFLGPKKCFSKVFARLKGLVPHMTSEQQKKNILHGF